MSLAHDLHQFYEENEDPMTTPATNPGTRTTHTAGEWKTTPSVTDDGSVWIDSDEGTVAQVVACAEIDANARLIVSAPDMLKALRQAEDELSAVSLRQQFRPGTLDAIRAAILRATGERG